MTGQLRSTLHTRADDDGLAVVKANLRPTSNGPALNDWQPRTDLTGVHAQVPRVSTGDLAPDGRHWFAAEGGQLTVFASNDGSTQEPDHPGFEHVTPYQWLSNDTIAATAQATDASDGPVSILTCRVSTNTCTVAQRDVGAAGDVVVASGLPAQAR
jgi:hypothetical protein